MSAAKPDPSGATRKVYEEEAERFDRERSRKLFEARWLARFSDALPRAGRVLDLGCGAGEPIASWLMGEGFRYTGVDYAEAMLAIARKRWPEGDWRQADMRTLDLDETFDGIVAWNSFFHLTREEQRSCLPRLGRHLKPGGQMLITVGQGNGEVKGYVGDKAVYHASLSPAEYASLLEANGMVLTGFLAQDPDCEKHSVLLARRVKEL
jgi:SAM-dependent methyltransferase